MPSVGRGLFLVAAEVLQRCERHLTFDLGERGAHPHGDRRGA
jgi:hypothetical protein